MRPAYWMLCAVSSWALIACGDGGGPLKAGAEAEANAKLADAKARYAEACSATPAVCPAANARIARVDVRLGLEAIAQGRYGDAKKALDEAAASPDQPAKEAAARALASPELAQGLAFEEAAASSDAASALAKIEVVAASSAPVSAKARAWIAEKRPAILLEAARAACKKDGAGSCVELSRRLAKLHPTSAEASQAKALADAEYARVQALLVDAEHLLVQQLELWEYDDRIRDCVDNSLPGSPEDDRREAQDACEVQAGARPQGTEGAIDALWKTKLEAIHDPFTVKAFEERRANIKKAGIYDPASWPKPKS